MTSAADFIPGASVNTPSGPGVVRSTDIAGAYVLMGDGSQEWYSAEELTLQPVKEVTVAEAVAQAVAAERQRLTDWLDAEMKDLIALGNKEACLWVKAMREKVKDRM